MPSDSAAPDSPAHNTTLAILAGGRGTRMGGPKAWLQIRGQPILDDLLDRFDWPGPTMLITAPGLEHPPGCRRFTLEVTDAVAEQGPLRGMLTAIIGCRQTGTSRLVIATVDMPNVCRHHLMWLIQGLEDAPATTGFMPIRMVDGRERVEPFPCAIKASAGPVLSAQLDRSVRAVHSLVPSVFVTVPVPVEWDRGMWINLNRPEDLAGIDAKSIP